MTARPIDDSQRKAARVAGAASLIAIVAVVSVQFGITARLMVAGNAAETARNIVAHETLFRIAIVGDLVYCAASFVLLSALYVVLKPVNPSLSFLAACCRLVYTLTWFFMTIDHFSALRLLKGEDYRRALGADGVQTLARLYLSGLDAYYVGLVFYALAAATCGWLWFRSGYIPRVLGASAAVSSLWCLACAIAFLIYPDFAKVVNPWWFDSPMAVAELTISLWLLFKGLGSGEADVDTVAARGRKFAV
jgi:Domain of unknown function (DUF4386)